MRKPLRCATGFALLALCAALLSPALSQEKKKKGPPLDPHGEPKGFHAGESDRYAVWHGKHRWHLRTTTAKREHHFRGTIRIEGGVIDTIHSHHLEATGKLQDHWRVNSAKNLIEFDFRTKEGIDGINFTVSDSAKLIHFNLHIDGKHHPNKIFVGHAGHHPATDPFTLRAHPPQPKKMGCGEEDE